MSAKNPPEALSGIRILDFTQMMLGPLCTQNLADLGADVIKVERPGKGEWIRSMPILGELVGGDGAAFHAFNRNKRSITVNLKSEEGRLALLEMVKECDVVVENYRSGVMDRLGLGYEDFKKANPKIIYASGNGWGTYSYLAKDNWPGQDLLIQAMSGIMFNTGKKSDAPTACGTAVADFAASQALAIGILGAIIARNTHGIGQKLETNLYSATLAMMGQENFAVLNQDIALERSESGIASAWNDAPYGSYPSKDGWVCIAMCPLDKLGGILGSDELGKLDSWVDRNEAKRLIETLTPNKTTEEWMVLFRENDVWAAPIRNSAEAMQELIDLDSSRLVTMQHTIAGEVKAVANPITLSGTPVTTKSAAPTVGQHTEEVLTEMLGKSGYEKLRNAGAL
ncbi:CoA transferase [Pseudovibrio sp. Tun.PSC04-5.I4]|uniref:CaiB/BaiF CoA transferase family protein n=1 Tax=Pseudovibrio sp. Tun.PSC04-5.I4 TaxID=1798213 RepID=UPI000890E873|nr:CoA transferase [Pseudovibrio sp. Tun.PSC04-5.I4]SDQ74557.1 Crotonobetainyl-CoA:carnitine CoA-transferase CaiB [Pseudovibrio sp. Tun.PSC04-5.I4]